MADARLLSSNWPLTHVQWHVVLIRSINRNLSFRYPPFSAIVSGWGAHVTKPAIKIVSWYAANGADKI